MHDKKSKWEKMLAGFMVVCLMASLTACSSEDVSGTGEKMESNQAMEQTEVEETIETQESPENTEDEIMESLEEFSEDATQKSEGSVENLTDEEWFKSLNLNDARFLIFNDITGERTVLENGQEYTLVEGDQLAYWYPLDWKFVNLTPWNLYSSIEVSFDCIFITIDYDKIDEKTELVLDVEDANGNSISTNVYLSR